MNQVMANQCTDPASAMNFLALSGAQPFWAFLVPRSSLDVASEELRPAFPGSTYACYTLQTPAAPVLRQGRRESARGWPCVAHCWLEQAAAPTVFGNRLRCRSARILFAVSEARRFPGKSLLCKMDMSVRDEGEITPNELHDGPSKFFLGKNEPRIIAAEKHTRLTSRRSQSRIPDLTSTALCRTPTYRWSSAGHAARVTTWMF